MKNPMRASIKGWTLLLLLTIGSRGVAAFAGTNKPQFAKIHDGRSLQGTSVLPTDIIGSYYSYGANVSVIRALRPGL